MRGTEYKHVYALRNKDTGNYLLTYWASSQKHKALFSTRKKAEDAVIMCAGERSKARAKVGSWITLAEWVDGKPVCVKTEQVDGVRIKADTWYTLKNGEFVECEIKL